MLRAFAALETVWTLMEIKPFIGKQLAILDVKGPGKKFGVWTSVLVQLFTVSFLYRFPCKDFRVCL